MHDAVSAGEYHMCTTYTSIKVIQVPKYLVTSYYSHKRNLRGPALTQFSSPLFLWCLQYLELLPSHTYTHRCTCIPHSHNISGSHRHCILLYLGASDSECVLTGTASALWSGASCHRNWRSSSIGEDVLSWWAVNPICYGHWRLRGSNDATSIMTYKTMNIRGKCRQRCAGMQL